MFRVVVPGALFALCLVVTPAAAEPFDDFVDLCVNNDARREVVIAKAEERGWFRMPAEFLPEEDGEFRDMVGFLSADPETFAGGVPADLRMVMVGRGDGEKTLGVPSLAMEACALVMLEEAGGTSWSNRLDRMLGFGATTTGETPLWVFSRDGAGFKSEADLMDLPDDQLGAIAKQRNLYVASVLSDDSDGLLFAAIRPAD